MSYGDMPKGGSTHGAAGPYDEPPPSAPPSEFSTPNGADGSFGIGAPPLPDLPPPPNMMQSQAMMNAALKAAIVELGLCTVDSMKSCVREEVHAANQMHGQRFQQIEASQTSMKQNLDALDAKFAQLEAKLQDAPMSAPVSPRTLKASVEAAVKKKMHRAASAPVFDKMAYDFNQIEDSKTKLKLTLPSPNKTVIPRPPQQC